MIKRRAAGTAAVLVSGGADSACLLDWAARRFKKVQPIYVRCGLRWEEPEQKALRKFLRAWAHPTVHPLVQLNMPVEDIYGNHWGLTGKRVPGPRSSDVMVYLPGRNLMLLAKAAVYCAQKGIETICVGTLAANPFRDAQPDFFSSFGKLATKALGRRIRILTPFRTLTKPDLIRRHIARIPLDATFSCLRPRRGSGNACGACNKCIEWKKAMNSMRGTGS